MVAAGKTARRTTVKVSLALAAAAIMTLIAIMNRPRPETQQSVSQFAGKSSFPSSSESPSETWDDGVGGELRKIDTSVERMNEELNVDTNLGTE